MYDLAMTTRRAAFDLMRFVIRTVPRGKTMLINASLAILGHRYEGAIRVQGFYFWIDTIHALNRSLFFCGVYEPEMTALFHVMIKPGMTVMDVGSNFGWYTILMAHLVGPRGRVYAFDMDDKLIGILQKSLHLNKLENVMCTRAAVGNVRAQVPYYDDAGAGTANLSSELVQASSKELVPMILLDEFVDKHHITSVDFIKCDIDGAEGLFIDGAERVLRGTPRMTIEIYDEAQQVFGSSGAALMHRLVGIGYTLKNIDRKCEVLKESDILQFSSINVLCERI